MARTKKSKTLTADQIISTNNALDDRTDIISLSGMTSPDLNFPGRRLIIIDASMIVSVAEDDVIDFAKSNDGYDIISVRRSAQVWRSRPSRLDDVAVDFEDPYPVEFLAPPDSPTPTKNDPTPATPEEVEELRRRIGTQKSIKGAAAQYTGGCDGKDDDAYENNCAHFLSNGFIRAGYSELNPNNDCIEARCGSDKKRPIRARNMWCWFQKKAKRSSRSVPTNKGYWAVFQSDPSYWGGHVVIIDTDKNRYFGTGNYPNWSQYAYQW